MKDLVKMFYMSVEKKMSIYDSKDNFSVFAFNSPDDRYTFIEVRFEHSQDYYLMPYIPGLPKQPTPNDYDTHLFTRAFDYHFNDELTWGQKCFIQFCLEHGYNDTSKIFEDWLQVEGENFIENSKVFLDFKDLDTIIKECVHEKEIDSFKGFSDEYKYSMGIETV